MRQNCQIEKISFERRASGDGFQVKVHFANLGEPDETLAQCGLLFVEKEFLKDPQLYVGHDPQTGMRVQMAGDVEASPEEKAYIIEQWGAPESARWEWQIIRCNPIPDWDRLLGAIRAAYGGRGEVIASASLPKAYNRLYEAWRQK